MKKEPRLLPGDFAIWIIIFAELLVFGIFFISYAVARIQNIEMFNHYQLTLNRETGAINTLLLITASYFIVRAVNAIKNNSIKQCYHFVYTSLGCGGLFLVLKTIEFYDKFSEGINISTNTFYMFYFLLTIFHYLHVILGLMILLAVAIKAQRGYYSQNDYAGVETAGAYWHMVDLAWIILFPLIYIIR
ncbi:MAG: cytochrome c oxidase subunit 3 family protein [Alcanivoracaceae bacterium]|nr:cytochrome c oxidase subunit 3 family protein [Alcanivoracaceae bacterium]